MTATDTATAPPATARRAPTLWFLAATALTASAAILQLLAAQQRWVVAREPLAPTDVSLEDHRYDYLFPIEPWENAGLAAQLAGIGGILLAGAVLAVARAIRDPRPATRVLTAAVVGLFALQGAHGLLSGMFGAPTPLQYLPWMLTPAALLVVLLPVLAALWWRLSSAAAIAGILLATATLPGWLVANFVIAPALAGYQSHDTTPGTEAVLALAPAAAAVALLVAAAGSMRGR